MAHFDYCHGSSQRVHTEVTKHEYTKLYHMFIKCARVKDT